MAQNLQQLKKRIKTSDSISQMAKAMEIVSTFKVRRAQNSVKKHSMYAEKINSMVRKILSTKNFNNGEKEFLKERSKKLIYIISPNKGLCGGLVTGLFKKVNFYVESCDYVIVVGKKAMDEVAKYGFNVIASFDTGSNSPKYDDVYPLIDIAEKYYLSKKVVKISIIYTEFKNILIQKPVIDEIFPMKSNDFLKKDGKEYIFEPNSQQLLKELLPYYFEVEFYNALINAYASEQAARMTAMKNARRNANDISISLTNIYNRSRQERITNEILTLANGQQET
ncbi:MAG: ATP synthase F1 subunit gamma [Endomicrobium sp.]|jgi:F-type H+-transporting ATPase subunit gamma|nr:ATP synthase F1 subunit gamma [Endomicrobium sp.]